MILEVGNMRVFKIDLMPKDHAEFAYQLYLSVGFKNILYNCITVLTVFVNNNHFIVSFSNPYALSFFFNFCLLL